MKVYKYGISAVHTNEELVGEQIWLNHRYKNKLIEIEKDRRAQREALQAQHLTEGLGERIAELEEQVVTLRAAIRKRNSKERSRTTGTKEERELLKAWREELKALRAQRREESKAIRENESLQEDFAEIDQAALRMSKEARANCGVYWGTYLLAEDAVKAAKKKPQINFHRWDHWGAVGVQIQGGMDCSEVFGQDTRVQLDPVDPLAHDPQTPRGERRRLCRTTLRLRVGSEGRSPVWASFRVHLHRPFPEGRIKSVRVHRERVGAAYRYNAQFVIDDQPVVAEPSPHLAGIDLGWRKLEDGSLRVATLVDGHGQIDYLCLPSAVLDRFRKVEDLQGIRKRNFNEVLPQLQEWLKENEVPEWLEERTSHIHQWRSEARLAALVLHWRDNRFEGDGILDSLEAWRKQDKHLWDWEANLRDKVQGRRNEIFRVWASRVGRAYGRLVLEDWDLRQLARHKPAEKDDGEDAAARIYRRIAAVSILKQHLAESMAKNGGEVRLEKSAYSTLVCSECGVLAENFNPRRKLRYQCSGCGHSWDQDVNAARNLIGGSHLELANT